MAYNRADVAVCMLSITQQRHAVVDFTFPTSVEVTTWLSAAPGRVPPASNLVRTMDTGCWLLTLASLISVGLALVVIMTVVTGTGSSCGTGCGTSWLRHQLDVVNIMLTPLAMITGGEMPAWFNSPRRCPGRRAGNLVLLTWSLMGMIVMFGFSCNLRAIYMRVDYRKPLDTAEAVALSGKTVHMNGGGWYRDFMRTSDNPWYRQLASTARY